MFETRLVGSDSRKPPTHLPEVAAYIGRTLRNEARGSDYVARVDQARWAAVLADTNRDGSRVFANRVMQHLSAKPCARGADGAAIYVKAIATAVEWRPELSSADAYLDEALSKIDGAGPRAQAVRSAERRTA
jgi:PleD family two-component response regulator